MGALAWSQFDTQGMLNRNAIHPGRLQTRKIWVGAGRESELIPGAWPMGVHGLIVGSESCIVQELLNAFGSFLPLR